MSRLRSNPVATNLTTSMLMMTFGDVMAQKIEKNRMEKQVFETIDAEEETKRSNVKVIRRVSLRRYMTKIPIDPKEDNQDKEDGTLIRLREKLMEQEKLVQILKHKVSSSIEWVKTEVEEIDLVRSASMGFWAGFVVTPGFMTLYKVLDRFLPKQTPFAVVCRVAATVVYSVPNNTAFFAYGTCVHHAVEWYDKKSIIMQEHQQNIDKGGEAEHLEFPDFCAADMIENSRMKIAAELWGTLVNSAKLWVPVHFVNFTVIPTHFRPFTISIVSIVWNCYLSLVQHRDICVIDEI